MNPGNTTVAEAEGQFPPSKAANSAYSVVAIAALMILSLWAGLRYYIDFERQQTVREAEQGLANYSRAFGEHTVRTARVLDQTTMFVKREYESSGGRLDLERYGSDGVFLDQFYNLIVVVDKDGWVKLANRPLPKSNVKDREHFQVHVAADTGQVFISKPVLGRSSGKWSVQFTRRINNPDGSFGGIVVTSLDPYYFTEFYKAVEFGAHSVVALVGTDGIVRARHSATSSEIGQDVSKAVVFSKLAEAGQGTYTATSPVDGIRRVYAYRRLKEYPLVVLVGRAESEILAEIEGHINLLHMLGGAITLLIMLASAAVLTLLRNQAKVEASLRRSEQEALSSSRMKSEFLARMSHELRTPLNGILGFSEYLRDNSHEPEHREFAGTIHQAGNHLLSLVNATLDLAKIEAGKMEISRKPVPLEHLVRSTIAIHQPYAEKKGLGLVAEFESGLPEMFHCDETKMAQVLNNLIHNAIKFAEQGRVTVAVAKSGSGIRFSVTDTGPGIPPEQQPLLFDGFRQLDSFNTRNHEGNGLGLALAKELVELMGGQIGFKSVPGTGSSFHFALPDGHS
jgi:two-component system, NarL family, sensor histidine kinase BarA